MKNLKKYLPGFFFGVFIAFIADLIGLKFSDLNYWVFAVFSSIAFILTYDDLKKVDVYGLIVKLNGYLPKFPYSDKVYHLIVGTIASSLAFIFTSNELIALVPAVLVGLYKEYLDYQRFKFITQENVFDFLVTCLGGFLVCLVVYLA